MYGYEDVGCKVHGLHFKANVNYLAFLPFPCFNEQTTVEVTGASWQPIFVF